MIYMVLKKNNLLSLCPKKKYPAFQPAEKKKSAFLAEEKKKDGLTINNPGPPPPRKSNGPSLSEWAAISQKVVTQQPKPN